MSKKLTYDELKKNVYNLRQNSNQTIALWKKKATELQTRLDSYVLIDKKPDYYYSFSGNLIFSSFCSKTGMSARMIHFIMVIGYCEVFTFNHAIIMGYTHLADRMAILVECGYVVKVKVPGKGIRLRYGWVLTQRGKEIESDYEQYYNKVMQEIRDKKFPPYRFSDGFYYKKRLAPKSKGLNKVKTDFSKLKKK